MNEYRAEELSLIDENSICDHLTNYEEMLSNSTRNIKEGIIGIIHVLTSSLFQENYQRYVLFNLTRYLSKDGSGKIFPFD